MNKKNKIPFEIVGSMRMYVLDRFTGTIIQDTGFLKNLVVETGKEFMLDEIFDNSKWNSGLGIRAVALGSSTGTNSGVAGPSEGVDIAKGGAWNDVSEDDWRLTDEDVRASILSKTRVDQAITVTAQFLDAELPHVGGVYKIREAGIFLHPTTPPAQNPQDNPAYKEYAMVARRVYYGETETYFVDAPFYKVEDGNPLLFEYRLELL